MASKKNQTNDRKSILRHLRKGGYGFPIAFFIIVLFISVIAIRLFIDAFLSYVMDNKLSAEYQNISYLAEIYERGIQTEGNELYEIIDENDRSYVVKDDSGKVVASHGENTMSEVSGRVEFADGEIVPAYVDSSLPFAVAISEDGDMDIMQYVVKLFKYELFADKKEDHQSIVSGFTYEDKTYTVPVDEDTSWTVQTKGVSFPIWLGVDVKDGSEHFYGKAVIQVNIKDGLFLIVFIAAVSIIILAVVIMVIARLFGAIATRNKMWRLFFRDSVTHQKNWNFFLFKGEPIVKKRKYAATNFAVVDVVFVKYRNYCLCHSVEEGEELLRKVDSVITKKLQRDELCTHYASANFACLFRYDDQKALKERLDTVLTSLGEIDEKRHFAFHIGVCPMPIIIKDGKPVRRKEINLEKEYNNACAARATLSEYDDSGIAFFGDDLVEEQKWIDLVRENQEKALVNEEFVVYYQPKYDPRNNKLMGAEALIRWNSPEFGFKAPGTIIPIFEKNGFITEIDHYMIRHVAKDQKRWIDEGLKCVPVSVNVSRAHFIESDLAEQIRDDVDAAGAPHELIEIELTESAFFDDKKAIISTIKRLKEYGFAVSMDDFGSGYSSLNSLKDMPLDVLKLDAEFFRGEVEGDRGEIVVSEAIKLAKSLQMRTVAEGVEAKEQVDFLAKQGCDMIQGFYFAKPMPAEKYAKKIASGVAGDDDEEVEEVTEVKEVNEPVGEPVEESKDE